MVGSRSAVGRFAPSTTGLAHLGSLLAALLSWLDGRRLGMRMVLRLEDLDPQRCRPAYSQAMCEDLAWFGLAWDAVVHQHERAADHAAALDRLALAGVLYPSPSSRTQWTEGGTGSATGCYDNRDRGNVLPAGGWRACRDPLRVRLPEVAAEAAWPSEADEGGIPLEVEPSERGDPLVRRRDGAIAYHLAVVVDDAASGVTRVVRGRDLASATPVQKTLARLLGLAHPVYRHHFLLLEPHGGKLAKLHGSIAVRSLREHYTPEQLCGILAAAAGLRLEPAPCQPHDLVGEFDWNRVRRTDCLVSLDAGGLRVTGVLPEETASAQLVAERTTRNAPR
jgi:glutamyl-Q tRNA(Asp) synthetase